MVLNVPKDREYVEITDEDLDDYNRQRRRIGQHRTQRQAYHMVTISTTKQELSDELAELRAQRRAARGDDERPHTTRGEHEVRGHPRHYRSGLIVWINPHRRGSGPVQSIKLGYKIKQGPSRRLRPGGLTMSDLS
jgi:hypothetical protein